MVLSPSFPGAACNFPELPWILSISSAYAWRLILGTSSSELFKNSWMDAICDLKQWFVCFKSVNKAYNSISLFICLPKKVSSRAGSCSTSFTVENNAMNSAALQSLPPFKHTFDSFCYPTSLAGFLLLTNLNILSVVVLMCLAKCSPNTFHTLAFTLLKFMFHCYFRLDKTSIVWRKPWPWSSFPDSQHTF